MVTTKRQPLPWEYDDGGRSDAGFKGEARDCVTRSIAIATGIPYREVYDELSKRQKQSARNSVKDRVWKKYMADLGWEWEARMRIGSGCTTRLAKDEIPGEGTYICKVSKHVTVVVDGIIRDTYDPSRAGSRCVYGWFTK